MAITATAGHYIRAKKFFREQYSQPAKILYVTDLHLSPTTNRLAPLISMIERARAIEGDKLCAIFLGGDLAPLPAASTIDGRSVWDVMEERPLFESERQKLEHFSKTTVDNTLPSIIDATSGLDRFLISGNRDWLAYSYIKETYSAAFAFLEKNPVCKYYLNKFMVIDGFSGINASNSPSYARISKQNSWYGDNSTAKREVLPFLSILMTHIPPYSVMDLEAEDTRMKHANTGADDWDPGRQLIQSEWIHKGCRQMLEYVHKQCLMLHLAGHIHDAPQAQHDSIYKWNSNWRSKVIRNTVTVNPGGHRMHDRGIRLCIIDLALIEQFSRSSNPRKDQDMLREAVRLVPSK